MVRTACAERREPRPNSSPSQEHTCLPTHMPTCPPIYPSADTHGHIAAQSLTTSLTNSLPHSLTPSLPHSLTHACTHARIHALTYLLTHPQAQAEDHAVVGASGNLLHVRDVPDAGVAHRGPATSTAFGTIFSHVLVWPFPTPFSALCHPPHASYDRLCFVPIGC